MPLLESGQRFRINSGHGVMDQRTSRYLVDRSSLLGVVLRVDNWPIFSQGVGLVVTRPCQGPRRGSESKARCPYRKKDVDDLERLQCQAARMVKGWRGLFYEDRLEKLNLVSLHVEDWEVIWSLHINYLSAPWIYPSRNSSLFQPSRTLLETAP